MYIYIPIHTFIIYKMNAYISILIYILYIYISVLILYIYTHSLKSNWLSCSKPYV